LLREEGLRVLRVDQRGILLNTLAGCYSALGDSEQAFAHMYQALRDAGPSRAHGFDAVLHCNLAHELLQLGDYPEALRHIDHGLARCGAFNDEQLQSVLLINRAICLTELGRPRDALPDIERVLALPADASGRGTMSSHFETLAIAALRAGEEALGARLVDLARQAPPARQPDEQVERIVATALLERARGCLPQALAEIGRALPLAGASPAEGLSLRMRCMTFLTLAELQEGAGEPALALASLRTWQGLHLQRADQASRARYQAAALQTEMLRLQHKLDENEARRRSTERAHAELQLVNEQLSRKIAQVQALQAALEHQATRDFLTNLFNRRHLDDVLPAMLALAAREQQPLAVVIIDLDHFKAVNDVHGHGTGDLLLTAFGTLLTEQFRKSDVACRYGGEEFCLLLPRTDAQAACRKVNAVLKVCRSTVFTLGDLRHRGLSFSAGVCDSRQVPHSLAALLRAADDALLAAKRLGRNRVLSADVAPLAST
jgi:diguanylate cyclase (GGDEF)-like protein